MFEVLAPFLGKVLLLCCCCYVIKLIWEYVIRPIALGPLPISRWSSSNQPWALVTGGGGGVGRGFCEELARRGFNIIVLERNPTALNDCRQSILKHAPGVQVIAEQIDFSKPQSSWLPRISSLIEHKDIAVLVNNVGMNTEIPVVYSQHPLEHVNQMVQVNCSAMLALTNLILPVMEKKNKGAIIFLSSSSGIHSTPMMCVYSATKAFIYKFAEPLSVEVAPKHIDVLILHPFYVKTNMSGFRRTSFMVVSPAEFARKAMLWLGRATSAQPIFSHLLLDILFSIVPTSLGLRVRQDKMITAAAKLRRRKEREGTTAIDPAYAQPPVASLPVVYPNRDKDDSSSN